MASVRLAGTPLGNARALGTCRPRRRRVRCRHGHRTLRLHPDPAADDHTGRPHSASCGSTGDRELRRIPRRRAGRHGLTAAGPINGRVAGIAGRVGRHPGGNAAAAQHNWMAVVADSRGIRERGGVRGCGQLDAGSPSHPTSARLGLRRCRPRHCAVGCFGADAARRSGLAGRMVDRGGGGRGAGRRRLGDAREIPSRCRSRTSPIAIKHGVRTAGSQCCSSATRSRESDTSSRAHSWSRPSNRIRQAGSAAAPGSSSGWPPSRRRHCGRGCARAGRIRPCSRERCSCRRSESHCPPWLRGRRGPHRSSPVRGHLHRGQHDGPGSRTPARISRRRGVAD